MKDDKRYHSKKVNRLSERSSVTVKLGYAKCEGSGNRL